MILTSLESAMQHFGIEQKQIQRILEVCLEQGGSYADLFFEHTISHGLTLMDSSVNRATGNIDFGVGVRVVIGEQTGYAYLEEVSYTKLLEAARTAAFIAQQNRTHHAVPLSAVQGLKNYYPILKSWEEISVTDKKPFLEMLNQMIFAADSRVKKVSINHSEQSSHILFANSLGDLYYDYRPLTTLGVSCVMEMEGRRESASASKSFMMGFEFMTQELIEELTKEVVENTAILFEATQPKGGEMPVVMGAGSSGILLHEAIGHAFEADFNRKKTSIFSDKLGKQICANDITIVDDATLPHNRGSLNIDDEGVKGEKTVLVKNGVLNSYIHDRISAAHYGIAPTGNGRRESFRYAPLPRMRATYMESGSHEANDLIRAVKQGVYVDVFSNGQVQIGAGDFTFYVKSGYLIENGRLTQPIKDINIIGNGPQALADITMVANNAVVDNGAWTCGKGGQSCAVTCGMPSVLVSKLTVGGY